MTAALPLNFWTAGGDGYFLREATVQVAGNDCLWADGHDAGTKAHGGWPGSFSGRPRCARMSGALLTG
jgi:hypothetical protein